MEQGGLIDYREIAEKYTFGEHADRANRYFAKVNVNSQIARKPFASALEVPGTVTGIAMLVAGLNLHHGARVLDFGAGTCWVSRLLAMMGCEVTAADVSANALKVGKKLIKSDPVAKHLNVSFALLKGPRLPFADGSFDRIVVFDAFHHCRDQLPLIGEFHRVLADGGIVAFHEPGANHSRSPQSQYEMRHFDVIEGDIVMEDLIAEGKRVGFDRAQYAAYSSIPQLIDFDQYKAFVSGEGDTANVIAEQARLECIDRSVFFLHKGGSVTLDSRSPNALGAAYELTAELTKRGIVVSGRLTNTGPGTWLPSGGDVGAVNVGAHLEHAGGHNLDYAHTPFSKVPTPHGGIREVSVGIPYPGEDRFRLSIDLVAEGVAWFELNGSNPVVFEIDRTAGTVTRIG